MTAERIDTTGTLAPGDVEQIRLLAQAARRYDGYAPLSESFLLALTSLPTPGSRHVVAHSDGSGLAGYARVTATPDGPAAELVVHPDQRRRGVGTALLTRLLESAPQVRVWAHGPTPAAEPFARAHGLQAVRTLHR